MLPKSVVIYKALVEYMQSWEFTINRSYTFKVYDCGPSLTVTLLGEGDEVTEYYSLAVCNSIDDNLYKFFRALCTTGYNHILDDICNSTTNPVK